MLESPRDENGRDWTLDGWSDGPSVPEVAIQAALLLNTYAKITHTNSQRQPGKDAKGGPVRSAGSSPVRSRLRRVVAEARKNHCSPIRSRCPSPATSLAIGEECINEDPGEHYRPEEARVASHGREEVTSIRVEGWQGPGGMDAGVISEQTSGLWYSGYWLAGGPPAIAGCMLPQSFPPQSSPSFSVRGNSPQSSRRTTGEELHSSRSHTGRLLGNRRDSREKPPVESLLACSAGKNQDPGPEAKVAYSDSSHEQTQTCNPGARESSGTPVLLVPSLKHSPSRNRETQNNAQHGVWSKSTSTTTAQKSSDGCSQGEMPCLDGEVSSRNDLAQDPPKKEISSGQPLDPVEGSADTPCRTNSSIWNSSTVQDRGSQQLPLASNSTCRTPGRRTASAAAHMQASIMTQLCTPWESTLDQVSSSCPGPDLRKQPQPSAVSTLVSNVLGTSHNISSLLAQQQIQHHLCMQEVVNSVHRISSAPSLTRSLQTPSPERANKPGVASRWARHDLRSGLSLRPRAASGSCSPEARGFITSSPGGVSNAPLYADASSPQKGQFKPTRIPKY